LWRIGARLAVMVSGMIRRLSGQLEALDGITATIALEGAGLAYEVMLPAYLAQRLATQIGRGITLVTFQYFESQGQGASFIPRLIGFQSDNDRRFFELFTTVKGIGNRKALRAMAVDPASIAAAIIGRDAKALTNLPEIGKRLAETVIAELSGKVESFLSPAEVKALDAAAVAAAPLSDPIVGDAVEALIALGETRADAETLVGRARTRAQRGGRKLGTVEAMLDEVFAAKAR